jgi:CRISPR-associated Cas5-like protein
MVEPVLCVTVSAPVVSFRRPLDHNYQRTLPMPPPTTLLGLAGAALGLPEWELWSDLNPLRSVKVSVWMEAEPGQARDMWTLLKIDKGKMNRSPYFRELLFGARYTLVYGGEETILQELERGFREPAFALSLGREDELVSVCAVRHQRAASGNSLLWGTVVPGDWRSLGARPVLHPGARLFPPVVERLPVRFEIGKEVRHPRDYRFFTFLPLSLEVEIPGLPALQCEGRNFVWLNS